MRYKVVAESTTDCDCADCRAGRHLYSLFYWKDGKWMHAGFSLLTYRSVVAGARVCRVMNQHVTTTIQAETDHHIRLIESVKGLPVCRVYHAWKTMGVAGLEAEIRRRNNAHDHDATKSQRDH